MASAVDPASLRYEELVALVQQLRQQLAERGREIERLKSQLAERPAPSTTDASFHKAAVAEEPGPGSKEDLLAQLEKIYPQGKW